MKKNIILLSSTFLPDMGGVQVGLHNIALNLIKNNYNPIILIPYSFKKKLKKNNFKLPYKIIFLPPKILTLNKYFPTLSFLFLSIFFYFLKIKYSVYYWHITVVYPLGVAFIYFAKIFSYNNYLIRAVGEDIQIHQKIRYGLRLNPKINFLIEKYLPHAPKLISISDSITGEYNKIGIHPLKIKNISNGVNLKEFNLNFSKKEIRKDFQVPNDKFIFLSVGRYHPKKNFELLIYSAQKLIKEDYKNFIIIIYGVNVIKLQNKINELNLQSYFRLINKENSFENLNIPDPELIKYYNLADTFLFPSLIESFGIVLIEAMAANLPTISFNTSGPKEITQNGKYGILAEYNNLENYTYYMKKIIFDKNYQSKYANLSSIRVKEYDWKNIVLKYIYQYEN